MGDFSVDDAIVMAARAHRGDRDKGRPHLPYITHPVRVMAAFDDPELQMIAILHDAVEDTPLTVEEIREAGASERVVAGIEAITHRTGEPNNAYWARVRTNHDAHAVKLADIDDNSDPARLALLPAELAERLARKYADARAALGPLPTREDVILDDLVAAVAPFGGTVTQYDSRGKSERVVVVQNIVGDGSTKNISISMDSNGTFRLRGHDTGDVVTRVFGPDISNYEWVYAVPLSRVHELVAALGGQPDEDVLELVRSRFEEGVDIGEVLRGPSVSAELSNWHS